jgi:Uri superfamily endonuclease
MDFLKPCVGESALINSNKDLGELKLAADQGIAIAQFHYGLHLYVGKGVSSDFERVAHYFSNCSRSRNC